MRTVIDSMLARHPNYGYVLATIPTSAGVIAFLETATKVGAFISVTLGIIIGLKTFRVQSLQTKKLKKELGLD